MAKRRWPKGARISRPGRLAIEKSPKIEKKARKQKNRSDLAPRVREQWVCRSEIGIRRHPDAWPPEASIAMICPICKLPMEKTGGTIWETVVRCPEGSPDADSRRDP